MTLLSFDASRWQGNINFAAAKAAGVALTFFKATEGVGYVDPMFATYRTQARAVGLTLGFYHFAKAGDPVAEADAFCAAVGPLHVGDLVALDWETAAPNPPAWCKTWLDRVSTRLGVKPGLYLNQSTRDSQNWSAVVADDDWLWVADYDNSPTVLAGSGQWPVVAIKQYTSTGRVAGVSGNVDLDVFEGDATALARYGYQPSGADMPLTAADVQLLLNTPLIAADGKPYTVGTFLVQTNDTAFHAAKDAAAAVAQVAALATQVTALVAAVNKLASTPVPVAQATQVVDELGKRLTAPPAA